MTGGDPFSYCADVPNLLLVKAIKELEDTSLFDQPQWWSKLIGRERVEAAASLQPAGHSQRNRDGLA